MSRKKSSEPRKKVSATVKCLVLKITSPFSWGEKKTVKNEKVCKKMIKLSGKRMVWVQKNEVMCYRL